MKKDIINLVAHDLISALGMCEDKHDFEKKVVPVANKLFKLLIGSNFEKFIDSNFRAEPKAAQFARTSFIAQPSNQSFIFANLGKTQISQVEIYLTGLAVKLIETIEGAAS